MLFKNSLSPILGIFFVEILRFNDFKFEIAHFIFVTTASIEQLRSNQEWRGMKVSKGDSQKSASVTLQK